MIEGDGDGLLRLSIVQAVADLRAVAGEAAPPAPIFSVGRDGAVHRSQAEHAGWFGPNADLRAATWREAMAPDGEPGARLIATAALLAVGIENGEVRADWAALWLRVSALARAAPAPVRAAVMNGFYWMDYLRLAPVEIEPSDADRITEPGAAIAARLVPLARAMSAETRHEIAGMDYGTDRECHFAALEALLARPGCIADDGETTYPMEVVRLAAWTIPPIEATGLLLIQALHEPLRGYGIGERWQFNAPSYLTLTAPWREPILSAFRHAYEAHEAFDVGIGPAAIATMTLPWQAG